MYWGIRKAFNSCPISRPQTTAGTNVKPTISGPNTLWWFKGLSVGVSGYSSQVNLTASASSGSSYQWSIASGSDKVQIQGSAQSSTVAISSIGQSTAANDVSITVTVAGVVSNPFHLTVKAPYKLGGIRVNPRQRTTRTPRTLGLQTSTIQLRTTSGLQCL